MPAANTQGMSLIETLVVVVIVSVLAGTAVLRLGPMNDEPSSYETLLAAGQRVEHVCQQAMVLQQPRAVGIDGQGLYWSVWRSSDWLDVGQPSGAATQTAPDDPARHRIHSWPAGVSVRLRVEGARVDVPSAQPPDRLATPQIHCGSLGERSAFELTLAQGASVARLLMPSVGRWSVEWVGQSS
ncbi:MAG: prepilin-type N-terminal cleavage/methylation domain-containing protein [Wenzhouxiangella sp.]|nr:prepilin-type N-terminal cleavage/methylation domain-containing protein [Wenzhouxiangella sp.]MDR9452873.1 prepilin-type N-terminal cleavage/methylation domain-containing protein [Wenzhouxiangella sp.]